MIIQIRTSSITLSKSLVSIDSICSPDNVIEVSVFKPSILPERSRKTGLLDSNISSKFVEVHSNSVSRPPSQYGKTLQLPNFRSRKKQKLLCKRARPYGNIIRVDIIKGHAVIKRRNTVSKDKWHN